jgi:gluconokinase
MRELRAGLTGSNAQQLVVMGVSGAGKTTIAAHLAAHLEYAFADGDDFQPKTNVAKLARAEPLTDADREPWLAALAEWIGNHHRLGRSTVLACSALKRHYRDTLRTAAPNVLFIHLAVPGDVLAERMKHRIGHFMPAALLVSQLATLEPLEPDERGITVDATAPPAAVVAKVVEHLAADA